MAIYSFPDLPVYTEVPQRRMGPPDFKFTRSNRTNQEEGSARPFTTKDAREISSLEHRGSVVVAGRNLLTCALLDILHLRILKIFYCAAAFCLF